MILPCGIKRLDYAQDGSQLFVDFVEFILYKEIVCTNYFREICIKFEVIGRL